MSANLSFPVALVELSELALDAGNPRRERPGGSEALTESITEFGWVQPIVARRADRTVIAGHQRLRAAISLGLETVPVIWVDLSADRAKALGVMLNTNAGEWDDLLLARRLTELRDGGTVPLGLTGLEADEITRLLASLETREKRDRPESFDLDAEVAAVTRDQRSKRGDVWILGAHRILCGDATIEADLRSVLGGREAAIAFTDPPYNVALGDHGGRQRRSRRRVMANDALDPLAWEAFVRAWAPLLLRSVAGAVYVCMSSKELPLVSRVLSEAGGHWSDTLIWVKDRFVLGRADYQRGYEPIWYGWRQGADHFWCGDRDQSDVWQIDRPADAPLHPVMKPLALIERALKSSSRPGDLVLDPFLGSGSTLIAAERTGRTCAGIELDPVFVDVALARWERFTGETATLHNDPEGEAMERAR